MGQTDIRTIKRTLRGKTEQTWRDKDNGILWNGVCDYVWITGYEYDYATLDPQDGGSPFVVTDEMSSLKVIDLVKEAYERGVKCGVKLGARNGTGQKARRKARREV